MSVLSSILSPGHIAGFGDAAQGEIQRQHQSDMMAMQQAHEDRVSQAEMLKTIAMDENWPGSARLAALHSRAALLSNPKAKPKDFQDAITSVIEASRRTRNKQQETNYGAITQASPGIANLGQDQAQSPGPAPSSGSGFGGEEEDRPPQPSSASSASGGAAPDLPSSSPMSMLAPGANAAASPSGGANALSLLGASYGGNPGSGGSNTEELTGTYTPAEKAERQMVMMRAYQGGLGGGGRDEMAPETEWRPTMGPHGMEMRQAPSAYHTEIHRLFHNDTGTEGTGTVLVNTHTGRMYDPNSRRSLASMGVESRGKLRSEGVVGYDTVGTGGQPVHNFGYNTDLAGKSFDKPVQTQERVSTGANGEQVLNSIQPGYNGQQAKVIGRQQIGVMPFADLKRTVLGMSLQSKALDIQGKSLGITGKGLDNDLKEYKLTGWVTLADGSTYTPNGTVLDAWGQAIAPAAGGHAYPTAAQATRSAVARDAIKQTDEVKHLASSLEGDFGPIQGRVEDWVVRHKITGDPRVAALQMAITHLSAMAPAIHQFRNSEFARQFDETIGALGQPYEQFTAKLDAFRNFSDVVQKGGTETVLNTQRGGGKAPNLRIQPAGGGGGARPPGSGPAKPQHHVGQRGMVNGKVITIDALDANGDITAYH